MGPIITTKQHAEQIQQQNFAFLLNFVGHHQEERWFAYNEDPAKICPICEELAALGWVEFGLLPKYKHAHSVIGEGKWNAPDSSCKCAKGYKRVSGEKSQDIVPLSGNNGDNPLESYVNLPFSKQPRIYTTEEVKLKLSAMKDKYKNHNCAHHD